MREPIIYRKWYPGLKRWFWMVQPCPVKFSKLTDEEKELYEWARSWTNRENEKLKQGNEK